MPQYYKYGSVPAKNYFLNAIEDFIKLILYFLNNRLIEQP